MAVPRNKIVVSENPRGRFQEAKLITATAKPGQCVKIADTTIVGGTGSTTLVAGGELQELSVNVGFAGLYAILTERPLLGQADSDTYAINDRVPYYQPLPGDDFIALGLSGETLNAGTRASYNVAGKLIADADGEIIVLEDGGTLSADTLILVRFGGVSTATAS